MARTRWEKEKAAMLANDPDAEIPCKKLGRPVDLNSLKKWMADLRQDYENANMEDEEDEFDKEAGCRGGGEDAEASDSMYEWQ